jgi:hypothetical protein
LSENYKNFLDIFINYGYNFRVTINNNMDNDIYNVSHETLSLFQKVKEQMAKGHKFFVEVTLAGEIKTGELVNTYNWSSSRVVVKLDDSGTNCWVPMNYVISVKC